MLATARVPYFSQWGMALLRGQLADGDPAVREAAQAEILEACEDPECFNRLIALQARASPASLGS